MSDSGRVSQAGGGRLKETIVVSGLHGGAAPLGGAPREGDLQGLRQRCATILEGGRSLAGCGYSAARRNLLALSEGRSQLRVLNARRFESFSSATLGLGRSHFHVTRFQADTECETVSTRGAGDRYVFHIPLEGELELRCGGRRTHVRPGEMAIVAQPGEVAKTWSGSKDTLNYVVERSFVDQVIAAEFGCDARPGIEFSRTVSLADDPATLQLMGFILADYCRPDGFARRRVLRGQLGRLLVSAILARTPHSRRADFDGDAVQTPAYVRRAERYFAAHLAGKFDPEALSAQAGVSMRTLYAGFKRYKGESPLAYLMSRRLERARELLLQSASEEVRIDQLARSLGFQTASHFARQYKARFGESPSRTLRPLC